MNDDILIPIVIGAGVIWLLTGIAEWVYKWWQRRELAKSIESVTRYEIPANYDHVAEIQEGVNKQQLEATEAGQIGPLNEIAGKLNQVREKTSRVRYSGYVFGEEAKLNGVPMDIAITQHSYEKGTGAAKQWTRGFCMAFGAQPKEWMDKA